MAALGRTRTLSASILTVSILLTDLLFAGVKLSPEFNTFVIQHFSRWFFPIRIVMDETDLWALTMNFATWLFGARYFRGGLLRAP